MGSNSLTIELAAHIGDGNQLVLTFQDEGRRVMLRPRAGIWDLLLQAGPGDSVTVEVRDFFQHGTLYDVYGAILADDGTAVASHWEPTGRGQRYQLVAVSEGEARKVRLVIGATPRRPGAPVPVPFTSWHAPGGSAPIDEDTPKKGD
jgi:hypothetical protein